MIYLTEQDEQESIHLFDLETSKYAMDNQLYGRYPKNELPQYILNNENKFSHQLNRYNNLSTRMSATFT